MPRFLFLVHSNAVDGREDDYNDWYTNEHLDDVVAVEGVVSAQRFKFTGNSVADLENPHDYLAIYEIEIEGDPQPVLDELRSRRVSGAMRVAESITDIRGWVYEPITAVVGEHATQGD
jgi:hypothetical protein